jgi:chemotaxis protein methyltransferase CheR
LYDDTPGRHQADSAATDAEFERLCTFLYRRTGLSYGETKRYFVDRRLRDRMAATGARSFQVYFGRLLADPQEVERLINAFTVNETYFYREEHQFRCLTGSLLQEIVTGKPAGTPIRIWAIPCSTGEEPYSIAIWLLENWPKVDEWDIEIVGSDIDTRVLKAAEAGLYAARALMRLPEALIARYFRRTADGYRIDEALRGSVRFTRTNVVDAADMARHRGFDVIFCRNLLIYFDEVSRRQAAENLYDSLEPGGYVCLGHTESMSRISPLFRVRRFPEAIVYQKPGHGSGSRDDA